MSKVSFAFSIVLILVNIAFLYIIVGYKDIISQSIVPGLTVGILGFISVILFAISLTWIYVILINKRESK